MTIRLNQPIVRSSPAATMEIGFLQDSDIREKVFESLKAGGDVTITQEDDTGKSLVTVTVPSGGGNARTDSEINVLIDAKFAAYKASVAEVGTGTEESKYVTPMTLRGSVGAAVTGPERAAGTETGIRRFSPKDIASMAGQHSQAARAYDGFVFADMSGKRFLRFVDGEQEIDDDSETVVLDYQDGIGWTVVLISGFLGTPTAPLDNMRVIFDTRGDGESLMQNQKHTVFENLTAKPLEQWWISTDGTTGGTGNISTGGAYASIYPNEESFVTVIEDSTRPAGFWGEFIRRDLAAGVFRPAKPGTIEDDSDMLINDSTQRASRVSLASLKDWLKEQLSLSENVFDEVPEFEGTLTGNEDILIETTGDTPETKVITLAELRAFTGGGEAHGTHVRRVAIKATGAGNFTEADFQAPATSSFSTTRQVRIPTWTDGQTRQLAFAVRTTEEDLVALRPNGDQAFNALAGFTKAAYNVNIAGEDWKLWFHPSVLPVTSGETWSVEP